MKKYEARMNELYNKLKIYSYNYYTLNKTLISDYEYDELYNELVKLENKYPQYKQKESLTEQVGNIVIEKFEKVAHRTPMLSLDNAFNFDELREFDARVQKELVGKKYTYVIELKIDGIAISLTYDKKLKIAATRGNGEVGENVTHNIQTIKSLPKTLEQNIEVRGEVYISKKNFLNIQKQETTLYANPRNLAAGTVRQLNNNIASNRNLDVFAYGLTNYKELNHSTYFESMQYLKNLGFHVNEKLQVVNNIEEVISAVEKITVQREKLPYEIDGIVIKVNEYENQERLGYTSKYPKWAIAYKFKSSEQKTKLLDIIYTVGRTGKITPNAVLEPVYLMGSMISKATLYNEDYIINKDIRIGDEVIIVKAGDIIPRVEKVIKAARKEKLTKTEFPKICPECHGVLLKKDKDYICENEFCSGKNIEGLIHFISKNGMNITGLGEKTVKTLYNKGIITDYTDIYDLNVEKLEGLEGFKEKSISNILMSIEESKNVELYNYIFSLGIKHLGIEGAKIIAKNVENLEDFLKLDYETVLALDGIGEITANEIIVFLKEHNNLEKINYLTGKGIIPSNSLFDEKFLMENIFTNQTIVITGVFDEYSRDYLKNFIDKSGGHVASAISKKTDFLFCGKNAGSKLEKAEKLGIKIMHEKDLYNLISRSN